MKAPKPQASTLTQRGRYKTPRPRTARKPFLKRAWEYMRKIDWKWILEFLKVIAALKSLFG